MQPTIDSKIIHLAHVRFEFETPERDPPKKKKEAIILLTTEPATPVLYVVKLPVQTASV
jgi:hypothetical protein